MNSVKYVYFGDIMFGYLTFDSILSNKSTCKVLHTYPICTSFRATSWD